MVDYGIYFVSPLGIPELTENLAELIGSNLEVEDEGDQIRGAGTFGGLWIACWAPHGMENDLGIPFENFDTVINVSSPGEVRGEAEELARTILSWVASEHDSHAILVRDVQEIVNARGSGSLN